MDSIVKDFPSIQKNRIYLNSASSTLRPKNVIDAIAGYYGRHGNPEDAMESCRQKVMSFLHREGSLIITRSGTEALNMVPYCYGLNLKKKSEIVVSPLEHHSSIASWHYLSRIRKIKIKTVGLDRENMINKDQLYDAVGKKTKIVCLTHVSGVLGNEADLEEICKIAHENDAAVSVDARFSIPRMPVDIKNIDFLSFSGNMMLGPEGIGFLCVKDELIKKMTPLLAGSNMKEVSLKRSLEHGGVKAFEAGAKNGAAALGMVSAVDYLKKIGMKNVRHEISKLTEFSVKKISGIYGVKVYGFGNGIISFNVKRLPSHDVADLLKEENIHVDAGTLDSMPLLEYIGEKSVVRASLYIYNTKNDIIKFAEKLEEISSLGTKEM